MTHASRQQTDRVLPHHACDDAARSIGRDIQSDLHFGLRQGWNVTGSPPSHVQIVTDHARARIRCADEEGRNSFRGESRCGLESNDRPIARPLTGRVSLPRVQSAFSRSVVLPEDDRHRPTREAAQALLLRSQRGLCRDFGRAECTARRSSGRGRICTPATVRPPRGSREEDHDTRSSPQRERSPARRQ